MEDKTSLDDDSWDPNSWEVSDDEDELVCDFLLSIFVFLRLKIEEKNV